MLKGEDTKIPNCGQKRERLIRFVAMITRQVEYLRYKTRPRYHHLRPRRVNRYRVGQT
jgi:transposase